MLRGLQCIIRWFLAAIPKFSTVRGLLTVLTAKQKDGLTPCMHYLVCTKTKKVPESGWWSKNPGLIVKLYPSSVSTRSSSFEVKVWTKGESPTGDKFLIFGRQHSIFGRIGNQWIAISSPENQSCQLVQNQTWLLSIGNSWRHLSSQMSQWKSSSIQWLQTSISLRTV